ncbi:MAG: hypothetical protein ACI4NF_03455 [Christensenellales bacterium]
MAHIFSAVSACSAAAIPRAKLPLNRLSTAERGEQGGAAAAPAGRRLPKEARAARSLGKAKI